MAEKTETNRAYFCRLFKAYYILKRSSGSSMLANGNAEVIANIAGLYYDQVKGLLTREQYKAFLDNLAVTEKLLIDVSEIASYAARFVAGPKPIELRKVTEETASMIRSFSFYAQESDILDRKKKLIEDACVAAEFNQMSFLFGKSPQEAFNLLVAYLKQDYNGQSGIDDSDILRIRKAKEHAIEELKKERQALSEEAGRELSDEEFRKIHFGRLLRNIGGPKEKKVTP